MRTEVQRASQERINTNLLAFGGTDVEEKKEASSHKYTHRHMHTKTHTPYSIAHRLQQNFHPPGTIEFNASVSLSADCTQVSLPAEGTSLLL